MHYQLLGQTGIKVSKICFGALGIGPLQADLTLEEGAEVIAYALDKGVNFIDTAEMYCTYPYIAKALKTSRKDVIITTKSYAYTRKMMEQSFEKARLELNRDYIDIFLLHEQESVYTLRGHWEAFEYLLELKQKGLVKAVGLSTHHIAGVKAAAETPEVDVVHPLINIFGLGIADGSRLEMETAIKDAVNRGKGVYSMKPLGGGNLINGTEEALHYAFSLPVDAVAVGMKTLAEVDFNISFLENGKVDSETRSKVNLQPRKLFIEAWCQKCGKCAERCSQKALTLTSDGIIIDRDKCVLCGYCASVCADFCIKVI